MSRIIDFPDGFTSATEPTTAGAIASFAETFATDAAFEAVYGAPPYSNAGFYFNSTVGKVRIHDGTDWRTNEQAEDNASASDPTINDDSNAGYSVLSLWLNTSSGALFRAVDVTVGAAVWTELAADAVLDAHINSTAAHGATGEVVGTTNSQTLTNKTLTSPTINTPTVSGGDIDGGTASNTNRLTLPKDTKANLDGLTRKQGTLVYASDTDTVYSDDGTQLNLIAGGGGAGSLDSWLNEDFETTLAADFSTGNSATFQGGGTLDGVLSDETTSPISGTSSLKYVAGASSLNDYFSSPVIDVDFKQQDNDSGFTFYFTWGGTTTIEAVVWDETNSSKLNSVLDTIGTADNATRYSATFYPPSTCIQVRYGFHILEAPTNGDILIVDDVEFSTNPFTYKDIVETQTSFFQEYLGYGSVNNKIPYYQPVVRESGGGIYSIENNATNGWSLTALKDCVVDIAVGQYSSGGSYSAITLNSTELTTEPQNLTNDSDRIALDYRNAWTGHTSVSVNLVSGDTLRHHTSGNLNLTTQALRERGTIAVSATATTEHVITPARSSLGKFSANETLTIEATTTDPTKGTVSTDYTSIKQIGSMGLVKVNYYQTAAGSAGSGAYLFTLPDGKQFKSGTTFYTGSDPSNTDAEMYGPIRVVYAGSDTPADMMVIPYDSIRYQFVSSSVVNENGTPTTNSAKIMSASRFALNNPMVIIKGSFLAPIEEFSDDATFLAAVPVQKVAYLKDVKAATVNGGTFTQGAWQTRTLNTVSGNSEIVALSANQFTLNSGRYAIEAYAPAYEVAGHKAKLRNITDSADELIGSTEFSNTGGANSQASIITGSIEIASTKVFEIQHYCGSTGTTTGFGRDANVGVDEIYTQVKITKLR